MVTLISLTEYAFEWYDDALDYLHDALGMEPDESYELDGSNNNVFGTSSSSSSSTRHYNEEDRFSWRETRVGSQLLWMHGKLKDQWREKKQQGAGRSPSQKTSSSSSSSSLSERDVTAREGLFHLKKAAEMGHAEAQRVVANSLASGILPLSDHALLRRIVVHQSAQQSSSSSESTPTMLAAHDNIVKGVPDDFSMGGPDLSRAVLLWHLSAMSGNVESAMALGYHHLYSATGGGGSSAHNVNKLRDDAALSAGYHPVTGDVVSGAGGGGGGDAEAHYGVLGTCGTAMAYYEAAANGVMDELEGGPTRGKVVSFSIISCFVHLAKEGMIMLSLQLRMPVVCEGGGVWYFAFCQHPSRENWIIPREWYHTLSSDLIK